MNLEKIEQAYNNLKVLNGFEDKGPVIANLLEDFREEYDNIDVGDAYAVMFYLEDCVLSVKEGILFCKHLITHVDSYWNGGCWVELNDENHGDL